MKNPSPWLNGVYAPVTEEIQSGPLTVDGAIPPELNGSLMRIGPNPVDDPGENYHWFSGDGMVHEIRIENGSVSGFRNRWVRTPGARVALGESLTDSVRTPVDPANTNVFRIGERVFALAETCHPYALDAELGTRGREDFDGALVSGFTAHPHRDPVSGEVHAAGYDLDDSAELTQYVIDASGHVVKRVKVPLGGPTSVHDFAMTQGHWLYFDLPLQYDPVLAAERFAIPYRWKPDYASRVGVLAQDAEPESIRWFEVSPGWVFHTLNAYEVCDTKGDVVEIVCDVVRFERIFDTDITGPGDPYPPQLWRWRLNFATGRLSETLLDERIQEFPRIDERFWGRQHRYGFTTELFGASGGPSLLAHDLGSESSSFAFEAGTHASEFVFVPASASAGEAEGWLLGINSSAARSRLVIFDASAVAQGPVASVELPQRVPAGFHGDWFPLKA